MDTTQGIPPSKKEVPFPPESQIQSSSLPLPLLATTAQTTAQPQPRLPCFCTHHPLQSLLNPAAREMVLKFTSHHPLAWSLEGPGRDSGEANFRSHNVRRPWLSGETLSLPGPDGDGPYSSHLRLLTGPGPGHAVAPYGRLEMSKVLSRSWNS